MDPESLRLRLSLPPAQPAAPSPAEDAKLILPILLLLMAEGCDRRLLFALLFILMG